MKDLLDILAAMASKKAEVQSQRELYLDMADLITKRVCTVFGTKTDEVAILILNTDRNHLRFVAPRKLAELGSLPVTKRDSIAVSVLGRKLPEVINNVPMVKHVAFFEAVKLRDRPAPIQKMITVPILLQGHAIGVAQISRKGESVAAAGSDFSPTDAQRAQDVFSAVAPYLWSARPDGF